MLQIELYAAPPVKIDPNAAADSIYVGVGVWLQISPERLHCVNNNNNNNNNARTMFMVLSSMGGATIGAGDIILPLYQ